MMKENAVYKIRDSVDLFLSNNKFIMAYYMNSRQRKSFRVNDEMIHLLEVIDGVHSVAELKRYMNESFAVANESTEDILALLLKNRIITEVWAKQDILPQALVSRYARQINYFSEFLAGEREGIIAQKKIIDSHILIFGCGAIGGNIAVELAMAGVGHFLLYDYDVVEPSDVARHIFYRDQYWGMQKASALKQELEQINSKIQVNIYAESMKPTTAIEEMIQDVDFVINTLDEPYIGYTAAKISRICVRHRIPHYIAGGFDAHLASTGELIIPYVTPCVECYADHFKIALKGWKPQKHPVKTRVAEIGGLASMSLFSSSFACIEILKYLAGLVVIEDNYKVRGEFLFQDMNLTYLNVEKNPNCPVCGGKSENEP